MDEGERVICMRAARATTAASLLFFFENGKAARVELSAYATVSNRRKLTGAYSDKSPLVCILPAAGGPGAGAGIHGAPGAAWSHTSAADPQDHPERPGGRRS